MLFRAQNLGPIRDATLDLSKNLIILAGPNNSGKTYLGWALYGLSQFNRAPPCVHKLVDAAIASPTGTTDSGPFQDFIAQFATELCALYAKHIHRDFSARPEAFASTQLTLVPDTASPPNGGASYLNSKHKIRIDLQNDKSALSVQLSVTDLAKVSSYPLDDPNEYVLTTDRTPLSSISSETTDLLASRASQTITLRLKRVLYRRSFTIFPVERIATTIFARELVLRRAEMLEETTDEPGQGIRAPVGRYPLPIQHSLRIAADLSAYSREESKYSDLADELENSVLQGRFTVSEHGDLLFAPSASPQQSLGLHQSASVVKSLSALVFYLRHLAQKNDHIIIDEPELNLHPDNQRKVARVLAKAANRGIKIMMSTHSDYLIGEFNNLLMLSRDTPQATEVREELEYDETAVLKPEHVGVYLVQDGLCTSVEVKETGFELKTFEDAFHSMNRDAQTIYNRIFAESE